MTENKKPAADKTVTVQWANVWTSKGKALKGDKIALPVAEIATLGDAVK